MKTSYLFLFILFLSHSFGQTKNKKDTFPAAINNIEIISSEKKTTLDDNPNHYISNTPKQTEAGGTYWLIDLAFDVDCDNTLLNTQVLFDVVGVLPDGSLFRQTVKNEECIIREGGIKFIVTLAVNKPGWTDFILTSTDAPQQQNLYNYDIRSNKYGLNINCTEMP